MEEKKQSILNASVGYGIILAVAVIIFSLLLFVLNVPKQSSLNYLSYVIMVAGILLFQFNYRNKQRGGLISYGDAFKVGLVTTIFFSIIMAIFTYIFFTYIDPGAIEEGKRIAEEEMLRRGMSDQEVDQAMKFAEKFQTPTWYVIWALLGNIIIGLFISLITAIFVKKEPAGGNIPAA